MEGSDGGLGWFGGMAWMIMDGHGGWGWGWCEWYRDVYMNYYEIISRALFRVRDGAGGPGKLRLAKWWVIEYDS